MQNDNTTAPATTSNDDTPIGAPLVLAAPALAATRLIEAGSRPAFVLRPAHVRPCLCGCGGETQRTFCPGHDARFAKAQAELARKTGIALDVRQFPSVKLFDKAVRILHGDAAVVRVKVAPMSFEAAIAAMDEVSAA